MDFSNYIVEANKDIPIPSSDIETVRIPKPLYNV